MKTTPTQPNVPATAPAGQPAKSKRQAPRPAHTSANYWTQADEIEPGPNLIQRGFTALKNALKRP